MPEYHWRCRTCQREQIVLRHHTAYEVPPGAEDMETWSSEELAEFEKCKHDWQNSKGNP